MVEQKQYSKSSASKPIEADEDRQDVIWAFVPLADYKITKASFAQCIGECLEIL